MYKEGFLNFLITSAYELLRFPLLFFSDAIFLLQSFARCTGISLSGPSEDPKVASWLLDPGAKEKNLHQLVGQHLPEEAPLLEGLLQVSFYFHLTKK